MGIETESALRELKGLNVHPVVESILQGDLVDATDGYTNANDLKGWLNMEIPDDLPLNYVPNLSRRVLDNLIEKHKSDPIPLRHEELLNYAIIFSGIHPIDIESRNCARLLNVYPQNYSFPFITGEFNLRRTPARSIPPTFQRNAQLHTPFVARGNHNGEGVEVWFSEKNYDIQLGTITKLLPLDSPNVVAYVRKLKGPEHKQDLSITINPLLTCGERCAFCYRQYGLLGNTDSGAIEKSPLVRISPELMAKYIRIKFSDLNLRDIKHFGLVTGAFKNYEDLYSYIEQFRIAMDNGINQGLDIKGGQGFTVLTHLATTREQMLGLKDLGVTELQHSMEIFDDVKRSKIMPSLAKNVSVKSKSKVGFNEVLSMVKPGQEIFGEGFSVSSILGIDDFTTTFQGLTKLKKSGLAKLSFPVYQTYNLDGIKLYNMTFAELIAARQEAKKLFIRQY